MFIADQERCGHQCILKWYEPDNMGHSITHYAIRYQQVGCVYCSMILKLFF